MSVRGAILAAGALGVATSAITALVPKGSPPPSTVDSATTTTDSLGAGSSMPESSTVTNSVTSSVTDSKLFR